MTKEKTADIAMVQTTLPDLATAQRMARALVETRDAACVQLTPVMSVFSWEGSLDEAKEFRLDIKTSLSAVGGLLSEIERLHPYDVPEVLVFQPVQTSAAYGHWVETETSRGAR